MQKKIALINDITGFGRCSVAVMAPIISAMKIQAVAVPTAILSAHTQFPTYYFDDYTPRMRDYIQTYKDLNLNFDAIATGFLGSEEQVDIVDDFIRTFRDKSEFVLVDPVMGDYGQLYKTYTPQMCRKMKDLVCHADITTPNLTEQRSEENVIAKHQTYIIVSYEPNWRRCAVTCRSSDRSILWLPVFRCLVRGSCSTSSIIRMKAIGWLWSIRSE